MPQREGESPTIGSFQGLIRERYFATDSARGAPATFMWFIEEVGELATALQNSARDPIAGRDNLEEEFADVLAWLCTLANISGVDLSRAVRKYTEPGRVRGVKESPAAGQPGRAP
jgi:NTP pyrophosphatase (non-canonical NTP hydrolase)